MISRRQFLENYLTENNITIGDFKSNFSIIRTRSGDNDWTVVNKEDRVKERLLDIKRTLATKPDTIMEKVIEDDNIEE